MLKSCKFVNTVKEFIISTAIPLLPYYCQIPQKIICFILQTNIVIPEYILCISAAAWQSPGMQKDGLYHLIQIIHWL